MRIVTRFTRSVVPAFSLLFAPLTVHSGPVFIEESAKLELPDPAYQLRPVAPAVDGDSIVLVGADVRGGEFDDEDIFHAAFLFERRASDGTWQFVSKLLETRQRDFLSEQWSEMAVAMEGGRLVINAEDATAGDIRRVYERGPGGWLPVADVAAPPEVEDRGHDSEVDGSTFIVGRSSHLLGASVYRKDAQGSWGYIGSAIGAARDEPCTARCTGTDVDLSGDTMIFSAPDGAEIWDYSGGTTWSPATTVAGSGAVTIEGNTVLVGARDVATDAFSTPKATKILEYARTTAGWNPVDEVRTADAFMNVFDVGAVEFEDGFTVASFPGDDLRGLETGSVAVFRRTSGGRFEEAARLVASDAVPDQNGLGSEFEMSGRRIVAMGLKPPFNPAPHGAYVFDLPVSLSQPATVQDDFEDGNSVGWTALPGSMWSVATSGGSRVFRQSNLGALDGATLGNTDWTNQAIEADVKPIAISGSDRWVGLAVRYTGPDNYYYVTLRSSNVVQIRRMVNGTFAPVASAPQTFTLNRAYRLRLEAVGTWLRVYVDGKLVLEHQDTALSHGQAVLLTSRASADFDNTIVSPNPHLTLLADDFQSSAGAFRWSPGLTSDWAVTTGDTPGNRVYNQRSTVGDARSVSGVSTRDQIIRTRAKATAFDGSDRWFGLMTRFVDDANYYYVTVRNSNQIALRKLTNGAIQQLDTAPMTVSTGTWYDLRMESVGSKHRVYVNDALVLEANDATHPAGRYGFRTYRTAAAYDDFSAMKP